MVNGRQCDGRHIRDLAGGGCWRWMRSYRIARVSAGIGCIKGYGVRWSGAGAGRLVLLSGVHSKEEMCRAKLT